MKILLLLLVLSLTAASAFFAQRVYAEVDMSGTARAALEIEESESLEDGFLQEILETSNCAAGGASAAGFGEADGRLAGLVICRENSGGADDAGRRNAPNRKNAGADCPVRKGETP
jgi:hypothetical protein